jgi:hypothetical protein
MTLNDLVSETEASQMAGVSARTLLRFSESGYLTADLSLDGSRSYSRAQLLEIFGAPTAAMPSTSETRAPERVPQSASCSPNADRATTTIISSEERSRDDEPITESAARSPITPHQPPASPSHDSDEISRLRNLIEMQERMLDAKDDEIADLRNQRAWLRERVEKLEEKSDRDQILLLQETQTIRQLIAVQDARKSVVQQVLEWIGVGKPSDVTALPLNNDYSPKKTASSGSKTIEVEKAANQ